MASATVNARYRTKHLAEYQAYNRAYYRKNKKRLEAYRKAYEVGYLPRRKALDRIRYLRTKENLSEGETMQLRELTQEFKPRKVASCYRAAICRERTA